MMAMASFAQIGSKHEDIEENSSHQRYSLSFYNEAELNREWKLDHAFIYGGVTHVDDTPFLSSFLDEV